MKNLRILIVEDEPLIAMDLHDLLEDAGHLVVGIANSLRQAMEIAGRSIPFDLAIMDIDLVGGPDGIETARRLREEHDVASLFVSGRLTDEIRSRGLEWNPVGFVAKPFNEKQILDAIAVAG